jgi:hypothetical protein
VGDVRFRQFAKRMIQRDFRDVEAAEGVGFSHGQFGVVVATPDHTAGELLPGAELYQAPFTMTLGWQRNRHADAGRHPRLSLP